MSRTRVLSYATDVCDGYSPYLVTHRYPGKVALQTASTHFEAPFLVKANRGGRGVGVHIFQVRPLAVSPAVRYRLSSAHRYDLHALCVQTHTDFDSWLTSSEYTEPIDGVHLVQEFIANNAEVRFLPILPAVSRSLLPRMVGP
jgi:hypothetical protein